MLTEGYILLHRSILKWEWYKDIPTRIIFEHLLLTANWEDRKWRGIIVKRGQRVCSLSTLEEETGFSVQRIRTAIKRLKSTGELTSELTRVESSGSALYTVVNYDKYQPLTSNPTSEPTNDQQAANKRPTSDQQQLNKDNKDNKDKEGEEVYDYASAVEGEFVKQYNRICTSLPSWRKITENRRKLIRQALEVLNEQETTFSEFFTKIQSSDFLCGRIPGKNWKANLEWICDSYNALKIIENAYINNTTCDTSNSPEANLSLESFAAKPAEVQNGIT